MTDTILRVMPREMRLMAERIFSLTALPKGFALMVGDMVMYSQAMGLGGFRLLLERLDEMMTADPERLSFGAAEVPLLDAGGTHGWFVVPSVLDLLDEQLLASDIAALDVVDVRDWQELQVAGALGLRRGLELAFDGTRVSARRVIPADPVLRASMAGGCAIPAELWWRVYRSAQSALTPDSTMSRRHAGVNIVLDDGRIIGRTDNDDDTDTRFISRLDPEPTSQSTSQGRK
ncbi:hypothetical protein [Alloyangia pacifica]|uniref:hypothetical protein n=1 Tax=Alloyangia pacifica TaxID=311180 RepID=UPI0031DDF417